MNDYAELVRAPAAISVVGDTLLGIIVSGRPKPARALAIPVSSVLLYWAGMALNDIADRDIDSRERPDRPIPSGRVGVRTAIAITGALAGGGVMVAAAAGGRRGAVAAMGVLAAVATYDLTLKDTPLGPAAMAACRIGDVAMGSVSVGGPALSRSALTIGAHTTAVTLLSRGEVDGATRSTVTASATIMMATAGLCVATAPRGRRLGALIAAGLYLHAVGPGLLRSYRSPSPDVVNSAVRDGVVGTIGIQAAAASGALPVPASVGTALVGNLLHSRMTRRSAREVS